MYFYHLDKMVPAKITVTSLLLNLDVSIQSWPWHQRNSITLVQRLFFISCHYNAPAYISESSTGVWVFIWYIPYRVTFLAGNTILGGVETSSQNWIRGDSVLRIHPGTALCFLITKMCGASPTRFDHYELPWISAKWWNEAMSQNK